MPIPQESHVSTPDLSKLSISRDQKAFSGKRGRRKWWIIGGALLVVVAGGSIAMRGGGGGAVQVETGIVANAWPSQAISVLNATGRVSAQRKAAVSTKATG